MPQIPVFPFGQVQVHLAQMLDPEFVKYLASLGVGGIIAGFMFVIYRKDMARMLEQWKGQAESLQTQNVILIQVIKENTVAFTQTTEIMRAFHARLDDERAGREPKS